MNGFARMLFFILTKDTLNLLDSALHLFILSPKSDPYHPLLCTWSPGSASSVELVVSAVVSRESGLLVATERSALATIRVNIR